MLLAVTSYCTGHVYSNCIPPFYMMRLDREGGGGSRGSDSKGSTLAAFLREALFAVDPAYVVVCPGIIENNNTIYNTIYNTIHYHHRERERERERESESERQRGTHRETQRERESE